MAKSTPSKLDNMPANLIRPRSLPATEPRYKVIDLETGKAVFTKNTAWHVFEKGRQLHNQGKKVDVVGWDDTQGKHRPVSEFMLDHNEHGIQDGDWLAVASWRFNHRKEAAGKTTVSKAMPKDEETINNLANMSNILSSSATALRRNQLTNRDMYVLSIKLEALSRLLDDKVDHDDEEVLDINSSEVEL